MPANPRSACVRALLRWEKGRAFSDEILHEALEREPMTALDRSFFMETFFGVLRNLSQLDFLISRLRERNVDPDTRAVLRLGLYQIFHMRNAAHAAVNETVALSERARGLVNAVLRRALREQEALERAIKSAGVAIAMSHPDVLVERWEKAFGAEAARQLCEWNNQPAEVYLRANELKVTVNELLRGLPGAVPSPAHPLVIKVARLPLNAIANGLGYIQDPSTLVACDLLDPQPGETVLDACAAPGGKTTYLAQLMRNEGAIVACDLYESRVARLRENLQRLGVSSATAIQHDCMQAGPPLEPGTFDRVLVDAPCSNTGVIRRRVDVRWRLTDEDFLRMPAQQLALLKRTSTLLKPGGTLVYSTCSLEPEENEGVVQRASAEIPNLRFEKSRQTLPFRDGVDGAFAARFTRTS